MKPITHCFVLSLFATPVLGATVLAENEARPEPPRVDFALEDQFEQKHSISEYRGQVLVMLYGDRDGMPANRGLGEKLHVQYHPAARGKSPAEAKKAPAAPVPGAAQGTISPDVRVVPVACVGNAPDLVKDFIRGRIKKEAPETVVLLDFNGKMKEAFGMKAGEPNLVLIDTRGRVRMKMTGAPDDAAYDRLLQAIDYLRKEGLK